MHYKKASLDHLKVRITENLSLRRADQPRISEDSISLNSVIVGNPRNSESLFLLVNYTVTVIVMRVQFRIFLNT